MPENIDTHTDEIFAIQHTMGKPPGWIVNWGITVILFFVAACLFIAAFIKYPDQLAMKAKMFSVNPPIEISPKVSAQIDSVYISDKDIVHVGDKILTLQSTVNRKDVETLFSFFTEVESVQSIPEYLKIPFPKQLQMGMMSSTYTQLMQQYDNFLNFLRQSAVFVKIKALESEITNLHKLNQSLKKQEQWYQQEVELTDKDYDRHVTLRDQGVISDLDKEKAESKILNEKRSLEAFKMQQVNNQVRIQQLRSQIAELTSDRANGLVTSITEIQQTIRRLKDEIREWEDKYTITSPLDGVVSYSKYLYKNQYIKSDEVILSCIPVDKNTEYIAQGQLPIRYSGRLETGQKALLDIESYPASEFGLLVCKVSDFSVIPAEDTYLVTISLPDSLLTSYNKLIPKHQNMSANVIIHTKDYSLLERFFQELNNLTKNKNG